MVFNAVDEKYGKKKNRTQTNAEQILQLNP